MCFNFDFARGCDWLRFLTWNDFKCATRPLLLGILMAYWWFLFILTLDYVFIVALISRGPSSLATFVAVYALFGPTFPGICDKDRGVYTLFYPVCAWKCNYCNIFSPAMYVCLAWSDLFCICIAQGLSFAFPIPSQYTDCCHDREGNVLHFRLANITVISSFLAS